MLIPHGPDTRWLAIVCEIETKIVEETNGCLDDCVYVFGGTDRRRRQQDLFRFDIGMLTFVLETFWFTLTHLVASN